MVAMLLAAVDAGVVVVHHLDLNLALLAAAPLWH
jgi:hypothetical protein